MAELGSEDILKFFKDTNALLEGHFILRSGLHSRHYFQCALLLQHTQVAARLCGLLADKVRQIEADRVISPALGGIIVGHEMARALGKPHIFAEKTDEGKLVLRRGFQIREGATFIVAEDVVTLGGRALETCEIVRAHGGHVVAVAALVDRSGGNLPDFGAPFFSLVSLAVESFREDELPPDLAAIPAVKPGSK
jgi:orotate phosphoribosyltransferase